MPDTPGLSFSPLGSDPSKRPTGDMTQNAPIQDAIKVLSMRVPKMAGGAPSLAPQALLPGGSGGSGGIASPMGGGQTNFGLEQLLRKLFGMPATGSFAPPSAAPGGGMAPSVPLGGGGSFGGSAPAPIFTPINPGTPSGPLVEDPPVDPTIDPTLPPPAPSPFVGGSTPLGQRLGNKYGV